MYPILKENIEFGYVVLFSSPSQGTLISADPSGDRLGQLASIYSAGLYSDKWVPSEDEIWREYRGTINLTNEFLEIEREKLNKTLGIKKRVSSELEFPVLMERIGYGLVVLFVHPRHGVVVREAGNKSFRIGYHSTKWAPCNDPSIWQKFTGAIALQNS